MMFHGLDAYRGGKEAANIVAKAKFLLENTVVVCGSDRPVGSIGVILSGNIHGVFNGDIFSRQEWREEETNCLKYSLTFEEYRSIVRELQEGADGYSHKKAYHEGWIESTFVTKVWYTDDEQEELAEQLSNLFKTSTTIKVNRQTNILDIIPASYIEVGYEEPLPYEVEEEYYTRKYFR